MLKGGKNNLKKEKIERMKGGMKEDDANQTHKEMTKDVKAYKAKSSQSRDLTKGRIGQGLEHLKFFLLVFLMSRKML